MKKLMILIAIAGLLGTVACNSAKKTQETAKLTEETKEAVEKNVDTAKKQAIATQPAGDPPKRATESRPDLKKTETPLSDSNIVGTYTWIKTYCCGRLRNTYEPKPGEVRTITFTADGNVTDTGGGNAKPSSNTYSIESNNVSFPERDMLRVGKSPAALLNFSGDTLLIDRGYIDLERTWWLRNK